MAAKISGVNRPETRAGIGLEQLLLCIKSSEGFDDPVARRSAP
jgi:hypothetical protein